MSKETDVKISAKIKEIKRGYTERDRLNYALANANRSVENATANVRIWQGRLKDLEVQRLAIVGALDALGKAIVEETDGGY